ncbi:MAG: gp436 family protein [Syntrophales bacterium]
MAYCTQANILNLISEATLISLTDDDGVGAVDAAKVTAAIADADATIDSYCQARYSIPLSPVPAKIAQISVDISVYNLYSRSDLEMPAGRKERNKDAIRFLEKVADGKIQLGASTPAPADTDNSVSMESGSRIFTRGKMEGF